MAKLSDLTERVLTKYDAAIKRRYPFLGSSGNGSETAGQKLVRFCRSLLSSGIGEAVREAQRDTWQRAHDSFEFQPNTCEPDEREGIREGLEKIQAHIRVAAEVEGHRVTPLK